MEKVNPVVKAMSDKDKQMSKKPEISFVFFFLFVFVFVDEAKQERLNKTF